MSEPLLDQKSQDLVTEISILPDGRIFVRGLSRPVIEVLSSVCPEDHDFRQRLSRVMEEPQP
jgi:hypothetical protein